MCQLKLKVFLNCRKFFKMDEIIVTKKINRIKKTEPLPDKHSWCNKCDATLVREGEKCKKCGHRVKTKHRKP